ncbi:DNA polymerase III subunit delta' [Acinetobacter sp. YH16032]|uniref:DNA polymerase III subunit delta' n=1 Tax=Acinetobacter sp. YH16032 TaxID=2601181 RepID=UPI0015D39265|nr:DNA polymerase III subunit delta' [Acinetobacter sp. YH16032]
MTQTQHVYPWQLNVWSTLTQRYPQVGHGLLFYGKKGCGKEAFTQQFVTWLLCLDKQPNQPCGQCSSCLWLKSDTHPNYVYVTTDEDNKKQNAKIKIEKIRELQPFVQQTVDGWRVIVIEPAEALNIASSNALLKTLEEPGERVVIILLADHYLKLPATIRSRLQHYALDRLTDDQANAYLNQHLNAEQQTLSTLLLNLSNGMPLAAIELASSEWLTLRSEFINDWYHLVSQKNMPMQYASRWNKQLNFSELIVMFEYLLADLVAYKMEQNVKNSDLDFSLLAEQYQLEQLFDIYNDVHQAKQMVEQNVQSNLIVDQLFIKLMNVQ